MATSYRKNIDGQVTTFDASAANAIIFPCDNLVTVLFDITTVAISPDNNNQKTWVQIVVVKRVNGGVVINGSLSNLLSPIGDLGATTWAVQASASGNDLMMQVTGQLATKINWFMSIWATCVMGD
jgi:hypothetical protein